MNQIMKQQQQISSQKISSHNLQTQQNEIQQTTNTNVINHRQKHAPTTGELINNNNKISFLI